MKAFVPPADPSSEENVVDTVHISSKIVENSGAESSKSQESIGGRKLEKGKRFLPQKSSNLSEQETKESQSRPRSSKSAPKIKIGSSSSEPTLTTPRNRGIGYDYRSQRLTDQTRKVSDSEVVTITAIEEMKMMRDDENRIDVMTPLQRRGLQSSEDLKKSKTVDDEESIQWQKVSELEESESKMLSHEEMMPSTLDTAMDWQHVQNTNYYDEEDDDKDNDDALYSPRYVPLNFVP